MRGLENLRDAIGLIEDEVAADAVTGAADMSEVETCGQSVLAAPGAAARVRGGCG